MKCFLSLLLILSFQISHAEKNVRVVSSLDLDRYLGRWFQIAAIPQFFQRNCVSNTVAEYSLAESNRVQVFNSCTDKKGNRVSATGRAKVVDPITHAKLKVTFLKLGTWLYLYGGNYWVLELDPDYRWAVVGEGSRKFGWILSRDPVLSKEELTSIGEKIKAQGYDLCNFMTEVQDGGLNMKQPLCEYLKN